VGGVQKYNTPSTGVLLVYDMIHKKLSGGGVM
jgi:hypothetical protein